MYLIILMKLDIKVQRKVFGVDSATAGMKSAAVRALDNDPKGQDKVKVAESIDRELRKLKGEADFSGRAAKAFPLATYFMAKK